MPTGSAENTTGDVAPGHLAGVPVGEASAFCVLLLDTSPFKTPGRLSRYIQHTRYYMLCTPIHTTNIVNMFSNSNFTQVL